MKESRNLAIVSSNYFPVENAGSLRVRSFAEALIRSGYRLTIYKSGEADVCATNSQEFQARIMTSLVSVATNKSSNIRRMMSEVVSGLSIFFQLLVSRYDLIIASSPSFIWMVYAWAVSVLTRTKLVTDIRDIYPEVLFESTSIGRSSLLGRFLSLLEKAVYRRSSLITCATRGLSQHISAKVDGEKIVTIPNGYDPNYFFPDQEKPAVSQVIFHGNLGKFQDVELLLEYARYLRTNNKTDRVIVVAGSGPKEELLQQALTDEGLGAFLQYVGGCSNKQIGELVRKASVGLSFRTDDGISKDAFPVKVYEYLAAGLPVIIYPECEASKYILTNDCGFEMHQRSVQELDDLLDRLLTDRSIYGRLSRNAIAASGAFNRRKLADNFVARLESVFDDA